MFIYSLKYQTILTFTCLHSITKEIWRITEFVSIFQKKTLLVVPVWCYYRILYYTDQALFCTQLSNAVIHSRALNQLQMDFNLPKFSTKIPVVICQTFYCHGFLPYRRPSCFARNGARAACTVWPSIASTRCHLVFII